MLWKLYNLSDWLVCAGRPRSGCLVLAFVSLVLRLRYERKICHLRKCVIRRKLKVLFVIGDECKWKSQSVYEAMMHSDWADPFGAPTEMDLGWIPDAIQSQRVRKCAAYLARCQVRCVSCYDGASKRLVPFRRYQPDIVIYLQPWGIDRCQHPIEVSKYAVTFYLPYCIPAYVDLNSNFLAPFYRLVYGMFVQTKPLADYYAAFMPRPYFGARLINAGTPFCDKFLSGNSTGKHDGVVIYAPHWCCNFAKDTNFKSNGTFTTFGQPMLEFARQHNEIKWVFKPHPMLRVKLVQSGYMTEQEVEAYYAEWARLGTCCYDSDYDKLFLSSRVMITDSISFLSEYLYVNKPLILLTNNRSIEFPPPTKWIGQVYEKAFDLASFYEKLNDVVLCGKDNLKFIRATVRRTVCGECSMSATERVLEYFVNLLRIR